MARLVLGVAGAAAGFAIGGPTGAQVGWMAGSLVGGLLTSTKRRVSIDESGNQTTAEGAPRAIVFGTTIVTGNIFYAFPARKIESEQGGKGGGPTATSVQYLRTYAIRICEGPIGGVLMVKQDGEIVYDARPNSVLSDEDNAAILARCTIYLGDEDQLPDADLEAIKGAGEVPAHRGTAYIVFADDDLTARGGVVPQYEFVVAQQITGEVISLAPQTTINGQMGGGTGADLTYYVDAIVAGTVVSGPIDITFREKSGIWWVALSFINTLDIGGPIAEVYVARDGVPIYTRAYAERDQVITAFVQVNDRQPLGVYTFGVRTVGGGVVSTFAGRVYFADTPDVAFEPLGGLPQVVDLDLEEFGVIRLPDGSLRGVVLALGPEIVEKTEYTTASGVGVAQPLSAIVAAIHQRCGHSASDYDVSELTDEVTGLVLASQGYTGADAIDTLRTPYLFDRAEWGGKVRYIKRGKPVVASLTIDDLVEAPDESTRSDPVSYPRKLHLKYQSEATHWEVTQVTSERITPDVRVVGESTTEVPVVLTAEQAQTLVAMLHKSAWSDAEGEVKISVTDKWLRLVTADCIGLTLRGITRRLRIVQIDGADGVRDLTCSIDRQSDARAVVTVIPVPEPSPTPGRYVGDTQLAVLDIPALTDSQDVLGYSVAGSGARAAWRGYQAQRSTDGGASFVEAATSGAAAVMGTLVQAVPAASPWYTDRTNAVRVQLTRTAQELASITDAVFLQRGGAFALQGAGGEWEVLQYRDAVNEGDGVYTLRTLHRGQLATAATAHSAGAQFVLLATVIPVAASSAWLGLELVHRGVSLGQSPDGVPTQSHTYIGRQQQEWPVASLRGEVDGGVLTAAWAARHRFGSDLAPVASANFQGFRVVVSDGSAQQSVDTTAEAVEVDVSAMALPITVTVAALNRITGPGPATTKVITA